LEEGAERVRQGADVETAHQGFHSKKEERGRDDGATGMTRWQRAGEDMQNSHEEGGKG